MPNRDFAYVIIMSVDRIVCKCSNSNSIHSFIDFCLEFMNGRLAYVWPDTLIVADVATVNDNCCFRRRHRCTTTITTLNLWMNGICRDTERRIELSWVKQTYFFVYGAKYGIVRRRVMRFLHHIYHAWPNICAGLMCVRVMQTIWLPNEFRKYLFDLKLTALRVQACE